MDDFKSDMLEQMKRAAEIIRSIPKTTYVVPEEMGRIDSWIPGVEFVTSKFVPPGIVYILSHPEEPDGKG